jgi:sugar/nucleoside kinase (ribokinase family)
VSSIFDLLEIKVPLQDLPHHHFSGLIDLLEDVHSFSKADLGKLSNFIQRTLSDQLRACDPVVRNSILDPESQQHAIRQAYALGQLAFAQEFAASVFSRRVDDDFEPTVLKKSNRSLVKALLGGRKSEAELSNAAGLSEKAVKSRLHRLGHLGAVDFRSDGKQWVFFLTNAAESLLLANRVRPI